MKMYCEMLFALILMIGLSIDSIAQSARRVAISNDGGKTDFVIQAKATGKRAALLLPAVQKVRQAAARSFANTLRKAQTLSEKVSSAGAKMTDRQYSYYQKQLRALEAELDKIAAGMGGSTAGDPKPGTVGECHKSCHDAFGDGFGGGKGWNRFWCKVGCIKVNFPGGSAGG